jgi:ABC-2 type transport system permease protein
MGTTAAIARRELSTFFNSPIAYIVLSGFLLVAGWLYFGTVFLAQQASLRAFFSIAPLLFVFFIPAMTMRLIAEEKKSGTLELLLTLPVDDYQVVTGKFLAALATVAVGLLCTVPYALTVSSLAAQPGTFDWGPVLGGYAGLLLMASSFLAIGLWASALSRNQIVGFIVGLLLCFALYFVDKVAVLFPAGLAELLQFLSVDYHFENVARGVLDTRDVLFYLSLTTAGLVLTTRSLASARR